MSDIYISGYSGRFPDNPDIPSLFNALQHKQDCVSSSKRYPEGYLGLPNRAGHLIEIDKFDNLFFKMNKAHVEGLDIQIRNLLEVVYEALVDSDLSIQTIKGSNTGVYVGNCFSDYHNGIIQNIHNVNGYENLGSAISMSANKISFFFDLLGPSIAIDTACSSSLHALSIACSDMESGKIDRAIVAGVSLNLRPVVSKVFQKYNMLSPDGTCYAFDDRANGYCRSESINAIILQRGSGYAKIIGHGINANGTTEQGITFPNVYKQTELFNTICAKFNIDKEKIEYIEAHGTGTTAGDNVEITALDNVYGSSDKCLKVGSIKSNMGHAEGASGLNSIIKCLMSYETGKLLPNYDFRTTSHKPIIEGRFSIVNEVEDFNRGYSVVNNFGFGGTNAHIILANGNYNYDTDKLKNHQVKMVFARTKQDCEDLLNSNDICNKFFEQCDDKYKFPFSGARINGSDFSVIKSCTSTQKLAYIYSGQGCNYNDMGKELFDTNEVFAETMIRLDKYMLEISDNKIHLLDLFSSGDQWMDKKYSSIGITSVQIGLTNILNDAGYTPDYIIGHSMGEIACSYADECLTEEQCMKIAFIRSELVELVDKNSFFYNFNCDLNIPNICITPEGKYVYQVSKDIASEFEKQYPDFTDKVDNHGRMLFVSSTEGDAINIINNYPNVCIACYNSVDGITLSGPNDDILQIEKKLTDQKIFFKLVETDGIAYHSTLLKPYFKYLMNKLSVVIPEPKTLSAKWLSTSDTNNPYCDALYHTTNIVSSVKFNQQINALPLDEQIVFLEISPNEGLLGQIKRTRTSNATLIPTLSKKTLDKHSHDLNKMFCHLWTNKLVPVRKRNERHLQMSDRYKIRWDHSESWKIITYKDFESGNNNSSKVIYNLKTDYKFLLDHQIQGQSLFPAMGHLYTIWQTVGITKKLSVTNFLIMKAIVMTEDMSELVFSVKQRENIIEVFFEDEIVSSAEIANPSAYISQTLQTDTLTMDKFQFYGQLSRYGYEYKNTFRMIDTVFSNGAHIKTVNHWISFLDGMLQTSVQHVDGLYLPTRINRVEINRPDMALSDIRILLSNKEIYVGNNDVLIHGLETTLAPSNVDTNETVKLGVEFVSYHFDKSYNALDIFTQIINENISNYTVIDFTEDEKLRMYVKNSASEYINIKETNEKADVIYSNDTSREHQVADYGFLITENTNWSLQLVASSESGLYLFRKVIAREYRLLDTLTANMSLQGNYIFNCPADSFVKSIHKEPDYEESSILCAYGGPLAVEHANKCHLKINIEQYGQVGSYRMIEDRITQNISDNYEIRIDKPGTLQSLSRYECVKGDIEVKYTGLNFKDVMQSYGKLKIKNIQLGLEFSGTHGVNKVMGMGLGLFKSSIDSKNVISWTIPNDWNLEDAATIPCVYSTVYYALDYKSRIQQGQSILIHAGAGGIGQAAIHICLSRGLQVYTTCSQSKRQFLKDKFGLQDNQIGSSRDNSFYNWIMRETGNEGVDVVLNSLAEDKLTLSLDCVKPFGQFCEIGKFDIMQNNPIGLRAMENNISLHIIDLSHMFDHPHYKKVLYNLIQTGIDKNEIMPLNIDKVYHHTKLDEAIRYMGGGNHMGKIIIQMDNDNLNAPKPQFHTSGTHLITGGMGGFGMELGEWLVNRGAEKVLLMGRNGITNLYQQRKFHKYANKLQYVKGDITCEDDIKLVFGEHNINGVWHLAMKLNDQLYKNLTEQSWSETIAVKETGAKWLDKYCPDKALFVCWSSISSLFGNAGQTNYAHGNNLMEFICRERRTRGKHGLSICWGAIDNIGYLAQENSKINKLMFLPQNIDNCLNDLHTLMKSDSACVSCYKMNHKFNDIESSGNKTDSLLDAVLAIIGFGSIENIDKQTMLTDLGMDSLQSASVKSTLKKFGRDVKAADVLHMKLSDLM